MKKINLASLLLLLTLGAQAALPPVTITGENYLSKPALNKLRANPVDLSGTNVTGVLPAAKGGSTGTNTGDQTITLTGDITGSGTGSFATTLATVNASPGTSGSASSTSVLATNGKGLVTSNSSTPIQITESQVTSLTSDLALKAPLASPTFTGTVTAPTFSGALSGNATTATTAGTISGSITESQVTNLVSDLALKSPLASPTFTGTVTIPNGASLGTPTTLVGTNITGTASALNIGGNAATATLASTVTTNANLTGPITSVGNATSVTNNAITDAMLAQVATATFKGRTTAGTGNVEDLTATQATALLNSMVGDSGSGGTKGLVPAPASGDAAALKVLRADGTWAIPSPLTTKGDLYTYSTVNARHGVPADYGAIVPDSGATDGWRNVTYKQVSPRLKNYVKYSDFENNATTGWSAVGCATVTNGLPVSVGSAGSPFSTANGGRTKGANTNSPAIDNASSVSGQYSLNLATTGAGVIGDGYISEQLFIDPSDQAKVLSYKLNYKVSSGTPVMAGGATNTYAVAIYDGINNSWLPVAGGFNFIQSSGVGIAQGTVQINSNTQYLQIFIYSPVAPTGTSSLLIDDVYVGPQALAFGPAMGDWTAYTPTLGAGFGTTSNSSGYYRRKGDSVDVIASFTVGTRIASAATISIPSGLTIDSTKLSLVNTSSNPGNVVGRYGVSEAAANVGGALVVAPSTSTSLVYFANSDVNATSHVTPATADAVTASSVVMSVYFTVPISGWSSSSVQSADSDTRVVAMGVHIATPTGTIAGAYNIAKFASVTFDTHSAYSPSTGLYTCPVSGKYQITGGLEYTATYTAAQTVRAVIQKNGSLVNVGTYYAIGSETGAVHTAAVTGIVDCAAGDTLGLYSWASASSISYSATYTGSSLNIQRLSGPAVVAASESVNARYYDTGGQTVNTGVTIYKFTTASFDSHNAYSTSTGLYTCPISGKYEVSSQILLAGGTYATNSNIILNLYKNGSFYSYLGFTVGTGGATALGVSGTDTVSCLAGETLAIYIGNSTGTTSNTATQTNHVSFKRIGN